MGEDHFSVVRRGMLSGKKAVCFGDSITWYDGHVYNWGKEAGLVAKGYESYLREEGMEVHNAGVDGATVKDVLTAVQIVDLQGYDYIFVTSGANDSRHNIPTGSLTEKNSSFNLNTFIGCLQCIVECIQSRNRTADIVLMTPIKGWIYAPLGYAYPRIKDGEVEERFAEAIQSVASFYGCILCDWYHLSGIEIQNRSLTINDPEPDFSRGFNPNPLYSLHPSSDGFQRMAELLLKVLLAVNQTGKAADEL